ncbi:MAG: anti-sigma factor [Thalassolituus sp.]|uniref:anti-sigma factor n=1 Tax=Thalassolituus sp. TaxID=2030822 RepID=UPI0039823905
MINADDKNALALEYVLGTLRGEEREAFAEQLRSDDSLMQAVRYWEQSLMPAPESVPSLAPNPDTFAKIQARINNNEQSTAQEKSVTFWEKLLPWKIVTGAAFAMLLLMSGLLLNNSINQNIGLNADYVAVLVDNNDAPILTALTSSNGKTLWLKWEDWHAPQDHSLQLWAKSRRDGQIRPLLVFNNREQKEVQIDEATLRLIRDSSDLIITKEEQGGSPLDEPSDIVIAKGVCIRLAVTKDSA